MEFKNVSRNVSEKANNLLNILKYKFNTRTNDGMVFIDIKTEVQFCSIMIDRTFVVSIFDLKTSLQKIFVEMFSPEGVIQILNIYLK